MRAIEAAKAAAAIPASTYGCAPELADGLRERVASDAIDTSRLILLAAGDVTPSDDRCPRKVDGQDRLAGRFQL
jgi:hypothetical protein